MQVGCGVIAVRESGAANRQWARAGMGFHTGPNFRLRNERISAILWGTAQARFPRCLPSGGSGPERFRAFFHFRVKEAKGNEEKFSPVDLFAAADGAGLGVRFRGAGHGHGQRPGLYVQWNAYGAGGSGGISVLPVPGQPGKGRPGNGRRRALPADDGLAEKDAAAGRRLLRSGAGRRQRAAADRHRAGHVRRKSRVYHGHVHSVRTAGRAADLPQKAALAALARGAFKRDGALPSVHEGGRGADAGGRRRHAASVRRGVYRPYSDH